MSRWHNSKLGTDSFSIDNEVDDESVAFDTQAVKHSRTLKTRAVYYLSKREYTRSELAKKLASPTYAEQKNAALNRSELPEPPSAEAIAAVLDDLARQGFLNDARFAISLVKRQSSKQGSARIMASLSQHQLDSGLTAQLADQLKDTELARCYTAWAKRYTRNDIDGLSYVDKQAALAKQGRFLMQRGFNVDAIRKVLQGWEPEIDDG